MTDLNVTRSGRQVITRIGRAVVSFFRTLFAFRTDHRNRLLRPLTRFQHCLYTDQHDLWRLADKLIDPLVSSVEFCASNYGRVSASSPVLPVKF
jgi:hypothetical protein